MRWLVIGVSAALVSVFASAAAADTVRLKNGRTMTGHVVKQDAAQVIITTSSGSEAVAASDVESIRYSDLRFTPRPPAEQVVAPPAEAAVMDTALLDRIRSRLRVSHRYLKQTQNVLGLLMQGERTAAGTEAQRAAQSLLPSTS